MALATLVSMLGDEPVCGTKWPGWHPPRPGQIESLARTAIEQVALNPQPIPPGAEITAYLWQSVRLFQLGQIVSEAKVPGNLNEALTSAANYVFDEYCGTVPLSVLLKQILKHWPPPPPPPWLDVVSQAVSTALIANKAGGEISKSLLGAAVSVIQGELARAKTPATRATAAA
jgi:hypothetical protein